MFYNLCLVINAKMVLENIKIYNMVKCGGDGLIMTKNVQICDYFTSFNAKMWWFKRYHAINSSLCIVRMWNKCYIGMSL